MDDFADSLPTSLVSPDADLDREFAQRLADSSRLAIRVAYGVLRNREDAEEVAQEAFARAYARFATLRDRGRFRAWLVRITWRLALDRQRANRRRQRRELAALEAEPGRPTADGLAAQHEVHERLWEAVDALPDHLRSVLVLAAIEGYDVREVARLLETPEGTVKSRLHAARKRLRESLRCLVNDTKTD
jgi:RNA polymerase sigma-70 factor (ECF subfamily)